jgi:hypothetical protein
LWINYAEFSIENFNSFAGIFFLFLFFYLQLLMVVLFYCLCKQQILIYFIWYHCFKKISKNTKKSSELLNFYSKTYEKFSIFYWNLKSLFNFQQFLLNIQYFLLEILSNSEDSQLQAKNTGYAVKNWKYLNSDFNVIRFM